MSGIYFYERWSWEFVINSSYAKDLEAGFVNGIGYSWVLYPQTEKLEQPA